MTPFVLLLYHGSHVGSPHVPHSLHTHIDSHPQSLSLSLSHTHTHPYTYVQTCTHTQRHTCTQSHILSIYFVLLPLSLQKRETPLSVSLPLSPSVSVPLVSPVLISAYYERLITFTHSHI